MLINSADKYEIKKAAAKIGKTYYDTLDNALKAAANDSTIELLMNNAREVVVNKQINIVGGDFTVNAKAGKYSLLTVENNTYKFELAAAVIGDQLFASIENAVAAIEAGSTVKLIKDVGDVVLSKPVDIDFNGHKIGAITAGSMEISYEGKTITGFMKVVKTAKGASAVLLGDTDADNVLEKSDIELLKNYFAGKVSADEAEMVERNAVRLDADGEDDLARRDLMILTRYLAGWAGYNTLPYGK